MEKEFSGLVRPTVPSNKGHYWSIGILVPFVILGTLLAIIPFDEGASLVVKAIVLIAVIAGWAAVISLIWEVRHQYLSVTDAGLKFCNFNRQVELAFADIEKSFVGSGAWLQGYTGQCLHVMTKNGEDFKILSVADSFSKGRKVVRAWVDYINRRAAGEVESLEMPSEAEQMAELKLDRKVKYQKIAITLVLIAIILVGRLKFHMSHGLALVIVFSGRFLIASVGEKNDIDS